MFIDLGQIYGSILSKYHIYNKEFDYRLYTISSHNNIALHSSIQSSVDRLKIIIFYSYQETVLMLFDVFKIDNHNFVSQLSDKSLPF